MSDLTADLDRIREFSKSLKRIHGEFTREANPAGDYGMSDLGSHVVLDAFDEFGSNWKIHREDLAERLKTLYGVTKRAANAFDEIDHKLAEALRDNDAKHSKKKAS
ncbi:hypothetical protein [Streptomyces sp. CA-132043]|uniref:hypothetical protein n=1 Tax=Streptomyces sp. CA-132043 TaxID=3240048 RepID=UPI003D8E7DCA